MSEMIVHLIDGTYELFRHFYGIRRFKKTDPPFGAVTGVLNSVAKMIEDGATHIGVATDHVISLFAMNFGPATRPAPESSPPYARNFYRWKKLSPPWVSSFGP